MPTKPPISFSGSTQSSIPIAKVPTSSLKSSISVSNLLGPVGLGPVYHSGVVGEQENSNLFLVQAIPSLKSTAQGSRFQYLTSKVFVRPWLSNL